MRTLSKILLAPIALALSLLAVPAAQARAHHGARAARSTHQSSRHAHARRGRHHVKHRHEHRRAQQGGSGTPTSPQPAPVPVPAESPSPGQPPSADGEGASSGASGSHSAPARSVSCDLFASPSGSDRSGNGSIGNPYQSVVKLDAGLAPGQTGCLRGGTYGSTSTQHWLRKDGASGAQITITAYPGEAVTVVGWVDIEADYTTIAGLHIDGSNTFYKKSSGAICPTPQVVSQSLEIVGKGDVFEGNDYYESVPGLRGNGIGVGFWGSGDDTVIRFNRIHDVGQCTQHDHLIYLASGENVQIYDNWLYNDHNGFGVTAFPHPTNAKIFSNVIDNAGSGVNFGDLGGMSNRGNRAWHNVVTNSFRVPGDSGHPLAAALVMCPELGPTSTGNEVVENDSFGNPDGISAVNRVSAERLSLSGNITADPRYLNAAANDYDVAAGSPVASWGLWNGS